MSRSSSGSESKRDGGGARPVRRPPLVSIFILAGLLLLVLAFLTFRQLRAGEANRLRLLAGFAEQVETTVPDLVQRYLNVVDGARDAERVRENLENVPNVSLVVAERSDPEALGRHFEMKDQGPQIYLEYRTPVLQGTSFDERSEQPVVGPEPTPPEEPGAEVAQSAAGGETLGTYLGLLDLPGVVRPIVIPEAFDLIVLARRGTGSAGEEAPADGLEGTVLFQDGAAELKLAEVTSAWEVMRSGLMETLADAWRDDAAVAPTGGGTRVVETEIADTDFRVFVQPVTLHLRDPRGNPMGRSHEWVACGVISWDRLLSSSFTTSSVMLFLMVSLIPAMLVAWPFLKLWLISRRQPFTRFDVTALGVSGVVGLALATLLVLDFAFLSRLESTVDQQLEELAGALEAGFLEEVGAAAEGLRGVRDDPELRRAFLDPPDRDPWDETERRLVKAAGGRSRVRQLFGYPFVRSVFWADGEGEQAYKIPFHQDSILRNRVNDRGYFRCPQQPDLATVYAAGGPTAVFDRPGEPGGALLCLESIRSKTTAGDLMVISMAVDPAVASSEDGQDNAPTPVVSALVTRPVSLSHALLPPGFSFAVVDRSGRVLFHADPRRNVSEDFLKATDNDRVLAALLQEGREGALDLHYWGARYRAWAKPLEGLPWTLVTLRSVRDLRTRNFELLHDFLNPFLWYLAGLLAVFLVLARLPGRPLGHLSPSRLYTPRYRQLVRSGLVVLVLFSLALAWGRPLCVLGASWGLPALLLLAAAEIVRRVAASVPSTDTRDLARGARRAHRSLGELGMKEGLFLVGLVVVALLGVGLLEGGAMSWVLVLATLGGAYAYALLGRAFADHTMVAPYVAALTVLLVTLAVLPAVGFFHLAASRQTQLLVQDGQLGLLRRDRERATALERARGPLWERLAASRELPRDAPEGTEPFEETTRSWRRATAHAFFGSELDAELPKEGRRVLWPYGRPRPRPAEEDEEENEEAGPRGPLRFVARLLAARPFPLDDLAGEAVGTDLSRFRYRGAEWRGSGSRLYAELDPAPGVGASTISSRLPPGGLPARGFGLRSVFLGLAVLALAPLVLGLGSFLAFRIALVELAPNRLHAALDQLLRQVSRNGRKAQRILVRTSLPEAVEQMARGKPFRPRIHVLPFGKLWREDDPEGLSFFEILHREEQERQPGARPKALLVTEFRPDLEDPGTAEAQIDLLERLQGELEGFQDLDYEARGRSMMIVTSRAYHQLTRVRGASGTPESREARQRWHSFLARFSQRHARDEGKIQMFESWIEWKRSWLAAGRWPSPRRADEPDWFLDEDGDIRTFSNRRYQERLEKRDGVRFLSKYADDFPEAPSEEPQTWAMRRLEYLLATVLEECRSTWRLQRVGIDIVRELEEELRRDERRTEEAEAAEETIDPAVRGDRPEGTEAETEPGRRWAPPTRRQLVERIGFAAQPYYQRVWDGCEESERQVLHQVARHGVANPKSFDEVLDLLNKGLLVRTGGRPTLRVVNRSFAAFVRRTVRRSEAWRWEEEEGLSAWEIWKWVLPIPLLLLGAFLFITQQDAFSSVVGLVVALASLVPTGVNLYNHFQQLTAEREAAR